METTIDHPLSPTRAAAGSLRPPNRLATGRAALGGLLVALAALGVLAAWNQAASPPSVEYLVVDRDLPVGTVITAADLRSVAVDLPEPVAAGSLRDSGEVAGATTVAPLRAGDLLRRSAVLLEGNAPAGSYEVSLTLDRARALAGGIVPGDRVDVVATFGTGSEAWTEVLSTGVVVTATDDAEGVGLTTSGQVVVSLAMPAHEDVLEAVHAAGTGSVTLVRTTRAGDGNLDGADPEPFRPSSPEGGDAALEVDHP